MAVLDVIDRGLSESQQNVVNLTEPDYDVYPLPISDECVLQVTIDITISAVDISGEALVWGHPTQGIWGVNKWDNVNDEGNLGFVLGTSTLGTGTFGAPRTGYTRLILQELINV